MKPHGNSGSLPTATMTRQKSEMTMNYLKDLRHHCRRHLHLLLSGRHLRTARNGCNKCRRTWKRMEINTKVYRHQQFFIATTTPTLPCHIFSFRFSNAVCSSKTEVSKACYSTTVSIAAITWAMLYCSISWMLGSGLKSSEWSSKRLGRRKVNF